MSGSDLVDFFTNVVFLDAGHESEVRKYNGGLSGLGSSERIYSRETFYIVEK